MKTAVLFLGLAACASAQLSNVHSVYLLPMSNGMDQYLANQLTSTGTLRVVTDAKLADAVLTDRVGEPFEQRMAELYPPEPPKPAPEPVKEVKKEKEDKDAGKNGGKDAESPKEPEKAATIDASPPRITAFARSRGNVFLVDVRDRSVLWSTYLRPKNMTPDEMSGTAKGIVERLRKSLSGK